MFSSKKCPSCGARNPKGSFACVKCSASLSLSRVEEQGKGSNTFAPDRTNQKVCPECSSANPKMRVTCVSCGASLATPRTSILDRFREMVPAVKAQDEGPQRPEAQTRTELGIEHHAVYDFLEGPIRWLNVCYEEESYGYGSGKAYYYDYGVPDPRVANVSSSIRIHSVPKKAFPRFWRVVDVSWGGQDAGLGIIQRLNSNLRLVDPSMKSLYVVITPFFYTSCWLISTAKEFSRADKEWSWLEAIAKHLLAEWPSTE